MTDGEREIMQEIERDFRPSAAQVCEIDADDDGWYITVNGEIEAADMPTCGDAVAEAEALGLTILNMDDVDRWMQPPTDWGIIED